MPPYRLKAEFPFYSLLCFVLLCFVVLCYFLFCRGVLLLLRLLLLLLMMALLLLLLLTPRPKVSLFPRGVHIGRWCDVSCLVQGSDRMVSVLGVGPVAAWAY